MKTISYICLIALALFDAAATTAQTRQDKFFVASSSHGICSDGLS